MVCIMSRCIKCNVTIADHSVMCPLCHRVLEQTDNILSAEMMSRESDEKAVGKKGLDEKAVGKPDSDEAASGELDETVAWETGIEDMDENDTDNNMYPNAIPSIRKMKKIIRITVFGAVFAETIAILINVITYRGVLWSAISGLALAYACFTLIYSAQRARSHQKKLIAQLVLALVFVWCIDFIFGNLGWSITIGMPSAILGIDLTIFVLMLVNRKKWQTYIMDECWMVAISLICHIFIWTTHASFWYLSVISVLVTIFLLVGTIAIGDKKAESELQRRFHV